MKRGHCSHLQDYSEGQECSDEVEPSDMQEEIRWIGGCNLGCSTLIVVVVVVVSEVRVEEIWGDVKCKKALWRKEGSPASRFEA
jgi:hypothetical protein